MIDRGLISAVQKAVQAKPREYVTTPILLAVVLQESSGVPYFTDTKPGSQFKMNTYGACQYVKKHKDADGVVTKTLIQTGFKESDIRRMITIEPKVGDWMVPSAMSGQLAKFRFEPGYWEKYNHLAPEARFIMSCSWGVGQFMACNISPVFSIDFVKRFRADVPMQLIYCAGMLDELLKSSGGDIERMYKGYNSGDINSQDPAVVARARSVFNSATHLKV